MNIISHKISTLLSFPSFMTSIKFMASKMQASSTQNTKDSAGKRLGLKKFGGEQVYPGDIIARQRGFKWKSGQNVIIGKDQTIHAKVEGIVHFRKCNDRKVTYYFIDVIAQQLPNRRHGAPAPYIYHPELFPDRAARNHPPIVRVDKYHAKIEE